MNKQELLDSENVKVTYDHNTNVNSKSKSFIL